MHHALHLHPRAVYRAGADQLLSQVFFALSPSIHLLTEDFALALELHNTNG